MTVSVNLTTGADTHTELSCHAKQFRIHSNCRTYLTQMHSSAIKCASAAQLNCVTLTHLYVSMQAWSRQCLVVRQEVPLRTALALMLCCPVAPGC